jgi:hypothetical protein
LAGDDGSATGEQRKHRKIPCESRRLDGIVLHLETDPVGCGRPKDAATIVSVGLRPIPSIGLSSGKRNPLTPRPVVAENALPAAPPSPCK